MGISSAMYSGVSGLNTNSQAMSVIGNNLANTNTIGFKGSRTVFSDLLSSNIVGSGGFSQVGRGVNVSTVDNIFSQGTFESTESGLDVAIEGDGFFILREVGDDTAYYSRAGAFRFDEDGFLVNPEGFRVQGQAYDADGVLVPQDPDDIQVENVGLVPANATTEMTLNTNLDASAEVPAVAFAINNQDSFNYSSSTTVYDSLGESHLITVYFRKTGDNAWDWHWSTQDSNGVDIIGPDPAGDITFNPDGTLNAVNAPDIVIPAPNGWDNGSDAPHNIEVNFETTQFDNESRVISQDQDGNAAGNLTGVNINADGAVIASYSNGEQVFIANLVLAKFQNANGLELAGSNLYVGSDESGVARVGLPGPELGKVFTNSLEQSNVDMGQEFVKMITVQRGFQANSKIITTVDELLGELINLKR